MKYGIIIDHPYGPLSIIGEYASIEDALDAARNRDQDETPTDLDDEVGYCPDGDPTYETLAEAIENAGWKREFFDGVDTVVYAAP